MNFFLFEIITILWETKIIDQSFSIAFYATQIFKEMTSVASSNEIIQ